MTDFVEGDEVLVLPVRESRPDAWVAPKEVFDAMGGGQFLVGSCRVLKAAVASKLGAAGVVDPVGADAIAI